MADPILKEPIIEDVDESSIDVQGEDADELDFNEWLKLKLQERLDSFHELSLQDQQKALPLIPAQRKLDIMSNYEKKLYDRILKQEYLPGTISVDYLKTSEYSFQSLLQGAKIVSKNLVESRSKVISASRVTGGSSICFNFYASSSENPNNPKAYKCLVYFYPSPDIHGNSSRLIDYILSENKKAFRPSLSMDGCRVACSCNDYFYKFSEVNYLKGCKAGKKPIITSSSTNVRNPSKLAGCCKHLVAVCETLKRYNLITD